MRKERKATLIFASNKKNTNENLDSRTKIILHRSSENTKCFGLSIALHALVQNLPLV